MICCGDKGNSKAEGLVGLRVLVVITLPLLRLYGILQWYTPSRVLVQHPCFFAYLNLNFFKKIRNGVGWDSTGLNGLKIQFSENLLQFYAN